MLRKSPLESVHTALGAKQVEQAGWQIVEGYGRSFEGQVGLADVSALGKLELRSSQAKTLLESHFNTTLSPIGNSTAVNDIGILNLRPDRFILLCPIASEELLLTELRKAATAKNLYVPMVNQTAGYGILRLSGAKASEVLSKVCAIDLRPHKRANLSVVQTSIAKIHATIARHDLDKTVSFDIMVARYNSVYLWEALMDAGAEFSIQPYGWQDMDKV